MTHDLTCVRVWFQLGEQSTCPIRRRPARAARTGPSPAPAPSAPPAPAPVPTPPSLLRRRLCLPPRPALPFLRRLATRSFRQAPDPTDRRPAAPSSRSTRARSPIWRILTFARTSSPSSRRRGLRTLANGSPSSAPPVGPVSLHGGEAARRPKAPKPADPQTGDADGQPGAAPTPVGRGLHPEQIRGAWRNPAEWAKHKGSRARPDSPEPRLILDTRFTSLPGARPEDSGAPRQNALRGMRETNMANEISVASMLSDGALAAYIVTSYEARNARPNDIRAALNVEWNPNLAPRPCARAPLTTSPSAPRRPRCPAAPQLGSRLGLLRPSPRPPPAQVHPV